MKDSNGWIKFTIGNVDQIPEVISETSDVPAIGNEDTDEMKIKRRKLEIANSFGIPLVSDTLNRQKNENEEGEIVENSMENDRNGTVSATEETGGDDEDDSVLSMDIADPDESGKLFSSLSSSVAHREWTGKTCVSPSIPMLLQIDQVLTQRILQHLIDWLDTVETVNQQCFQWIYSLLSRIEKPLHRDMIASIRQLYRRCCELRAALKKPAEKHSGKENGDTSFDQDLAMLNLIITITGYYFGQSELSGIRHSILAVDEKRETNNKISANDDATETFPVNGENLLLSFQGEEGELELDFSDNEEGEEED
jgi:hypothetical protein